MGGHIALELMYVVGLEPAHENIDEVKIVVAVNSCHAGLLAVVIWVSMVPIIRLSKEPIVALLHSKTVIYSHFRWASLMLSIGAAPHRMVLLRRMSIGATGIAATELKPSTPGLM